ncbi:MAG: nucleotide exchange factor GrpE [Vicinamibacterales bacterium]
MAEDLRTRDDESGVTAAGDPLAALTRERDELRDRLLRATAEFDNYRKRTERERRELNEAAATDLIRDVLPVLDDFERALAAPGWDRTGAARQGVELIHRQFLETLRRRGVEPLDVVGLPFDPLWHEAVAAEPAAGRPDGEITAEIRRGYRIGQRLLRPAQVRVARA